MRALAVFLIAGLALAGILAATPEPGSSRLVSVEQLPEEMAQMCAWDEVASNNTPASQNQIASLEPQNLFTTIQSIAEPQPQQRRNQLPPAVNEVTREPQFRTLADTFPTYTSVAVNLESDEVFLQDNNLWSTRVFNRLDNTAPNADMTQPKRIIQGLKSHIQYNNGIYIDPKNGDIYSVESDTGDRMVVNTRPRSLFTARKPRVTSHPFASLKETTPDSRRRTVSRSTRGTTCCTSTTGVSS